MISIIPEHAPTPNNPDTLKLLVAKEKLATFEPDDAILTLNMYAEDFCNDIKELDSSGPLSGKINLETLETAIKFMVVTYEDENIIHTKYTELFHKFLRQKFYWGVT